MLLSWSLPRVFVPAPEWRVRTSFSLTPARLRSTASQRLKAKEVACSAPPAALDRSTARALVDAGYMPLSRYVELFEGAEARPHERAA